MKKAVLIIFFGLLWSAKVYSANCDLDVDELKISEYGHYITVNVYNPSDNFTAVTGVKYYNGEQLLRTYTDIYETVSAKSNKVFNHKTSESFLETIDKVVFTCD